MNEDIEKIKQFELSLKCANEMLEIQGRNGNYNYDSYMLGRYNGMECIISLFECREPNYRNGKEIEFLNDKQLQNNWNELKKFIEKEIKKTYELTTEDLKEERDLAISVYRFIQWKMQELEQGKDEL